MTVRVTWFDVAQAEEEHADELAGDVAGGHLPGYPSAPQPLVIGSEGCRMAVGLDERHDPQPDFTPGKAIALLTETVAEDAGTGLGRLLIPAEMLAELTDGLEGQVIIVGSPGGA